MNKKEALRLAFNILVGAPTRSAWGEARLVGTNGKVLATYKDACDAVHKAYMCLEPDDDTPVLIGISKKGTLHALRPSGLLYCESEVAVENQRDGHWGEVNCKTCNSRRNTKSRTGDV